MAAITNKTPNNLLRICSEIECAIFEPILAVIMLALAIPSTAGQKINPVAPAGRFGWVCQKYRYPMAPARAIGTPHAAAVPMPCLILYPANVIKGVVNDPPPMPKIDDKKPIHPP